MPKNLPTLSKLGNKITQRFLYFFMVLNLRPSCRFNVCFERYFQAPSPKAIKKRKKKNKTNSHIPVA